MSAGPGRPEFYFYSGIQKHKHPFEFPISAAPGAPAEEPSYLLIGELLSPDEQVDPREAGPSAEEGHLHALVRISETQQQTTGWGRGHASRQCADNGFCILRLMECWMK